MSFDHAGAGLVGLAATANLMIAQVAPADVASYGEVISRIGATAILGIAVLVLWRKSEKQSAEKEALVSRYVEELRGVIKENTQTIQRNTDTLDRIEKKL